MGIVGTVLLVLGVVFFVVLIVVFASMGNGMVGYPG